MSIVEILKVIVLGIVEGFTEWLPISSTGHMILVDEIIHLNQPDPLKRVSDTGCKCTVLGYVSGSDPVRCHPCSCGHVFPEIKPIQPI